MKHTVPTLICLHIRLVKEGKLLIVITRSVTVKAVATPSKNIYDPLNTVSGRPSHSVKFHDIYNCKIFIRLSLWASLRRKKRNYLKLELEQFYETLKKAETGLENIFKKMFFCGDIPPWWGGGSAGVNSRKPRKTPWRTT